MIKVKNIKQVVFIKASPHEVYESLVDSKKHARFTGERAKMSKKVGGKFTAYSTYISGKNIELIPDERIVQSWRASDWPNKHYSEVVFLLKPIRNGTKLIFSQKGIPLECVKNITSGWKLYYWKPLKLMLEK